MPLARFPLPVPGLALCLLCLICLICNTASADRLRIAVAANFKPTLQRLNAEFESRSGHRIVTSSASSGVLATQLMQGAPFDVFFSADEQAPRTVLEKLSIPAEQMFCYARGQLALVGPKAGLLDLHDPGVSLAIANPATAPYGRAAMDVLSREEFRTGKQRKLVRGNNAIQAYQYWYTGAVDAALVPRSLVARGEATHVPVHWHQPIEQHALVMKRGQVVDAYIDWLRSDTVRERLQEAGYLPCH